jgi:transcriptional regulator with XRE-family HTH domain
VLSDTLKRELAGYAVGEKMRALRWEKRLKLVEVARRAGLSPALVSKIERGKSVPSLSALFSIAQALEVGLSFFFPKPALKTAVVSRQKDRIRLPELSKRRDSAYDFECLSFGVFESKLNGYYAELKSNRASHPHTHPGHELLYVMRGNLRIMIHRDEHILHAGDSIYFESGVPHSYCKIGTDATNILVITIPTTIPAAELDTAGTGEFLHLRSKEIIWRRTG